MDWIDLIQDKDKWWTVVFAAMKLLVLYDVVEFLTD
jgi:hypothetical protein